MARFLSDLAQHHVAQNLHRPLVEKQTLEF